MEHNPCTIITTTPHGQIIITNNRIHLTTPCCGTLTELDNNNHPACTNCGTTVDIVHTYTAPIRHPVAISVIRSFLTRTGTPYHEAEHQARSLLAQTRASL